MKTGIVLALLALVIVWVWASGKGAAVLQALFSGSSSTVASTTPAGSGTSTISSVAVDEAALNSSIAGVIQNGSAGFANANNVSTTPLSLSNAVGGLSIPQYIAPNGNAGSGTITVPTFYPGTPSS